MGDYTVIDDIEETLKKLLKKGLDDVFGVDKVGITFDAPKDPKDDTENKVLVYLFQVVENIFLKNEGPERMDDGHLKNPPQYLDLLYFIIPYGKDKKLILGKVMQIFYDNSVLKGTILQKGLAGTDEEMRIILNPLSLDDLTKLWSAFKDVTFRLSVSYLVTPVRIDSSRITGTSRVISSELGYYDNIPEIERR
jgi:hypothetical protein